ncbi:hypothetical protein BDZ90DRAFT_275416 [Jaminaea rosea]|uniref:Uncharacterized protein n=1 Tax=Jaminaea rosea TaxID=1569628 RepID=A0A316UMT3_9BASI|nr:hypothetical protein BDZ90DRAFT_275416 [Jaminaea rosea]PWN26274.1 hypothetical protein BDZ90DRAFT_275416 [Jaminaea rosea]
MATQGYREVYVDLTNSQATSILEPSQEAGPSHSPAQHSRETTPPPPPPAPATSSARPAEPDPPIPSALLQPSPPRRNLRTRKPGQLHPYTVEMALYKRRLERNDWEDAVVTDHHMRRRMREERERAAANELPVEGDEASSSWLVADLPGDREGEERKKRRAEAREDKRKRREERRKEAERVAAAAVAEESQARRASSASNTKGKGKAKEPSAPPRQGLSAKELFARYGGLISDEEDDSDGDDAAGGGVDRSPALARQSSARADRQLGPKQRQRRRTAQADNSDASSGSGSRSPSPVLPLRKRRLISSSSSSSSSSPHSPTRPRSAARSHSASSSSSSESSEEEELDLDRYFRQLKRMMPVSMARKYIADLRAMRKGKAYHSDGHVSDTPEPSNTSESEDGEIDGGDATMTPSTSPAEAAALRPGEARKRLGRGTPTGDARFELVGDSDSDSSSSARSAVSVRSSNSEGQRRDYQVYDGDIRWWAQPTEERPAPRREEDAIDRMLSRAVGAPRKARRPGGGGAKRMRAMNATSASRRQGAVSGGRQAGGSSALRERSVNHPALASSVPKQPSRAKRKRYGGVSRPSRSSGPRSAGGPHPLAPNPPLVQPKVRRPLDLRQDDVLFDVELLAQPLPPSRDDERGEDEDAAAAREYAQRVRSYREQSQPSRPLVRRRVGRGGDGRKDLHASPAGQPHSAAGPRPVVRTGSRDSTSSKSPSVATSPQPPGQQRNKGLRPFLRVESWDRPSSSTASGQLSRAQLDADAWGDLANLRLDFGIRPLPAGLSFSPASAIGRGRLFELVELGEGGNQENAALSRIAGRTVLGVDLPPHPDVAVMLQLMPAIFDAIFAATETIRSGRGDAGEEINGESAPDTLSAAVTRTTHGIDDLLRYLAQGITSLADFVPPREVRQYVASIKSQMVHLFDRFQAAPTADQGQEGRQRQKSFETLLLTLRWFDVEVSWRHIASKGLQNADAIDFEEKLADEEELILACEGLMISLLSHGMHRTMHCIKTRAKRDSSIDAAPSHIDDTSAELWVSLIHLLGTAATLLGPHMAFWPVLDSSLSQWLKILPPRRPVLMSEAIWFVTLSLCALSQFSAANGTTLSRPQLRQHWPLVVQAFAATRLRYDESVEQAMPSAALAKRDQYLRAITQRCFNLVSLWRWSGEGAEGALSKIFDVFNAHKLADLPTEEDHDFPPFLRDFNPELLFDETSREGTTYHVFLKLLAHVARSLQATASPEDDPAAAATAADRKISRLFSRVCPVRVMTFSKANPPTARERSSLFNHYSVATLHLFLVPSAAQQRLRQIKSFLVFKEADAQSQVTCIRAMMYAAVVHRHFELDVAPITAWFGSIFKTLLGDAEEVNRKVARGGGATAAAGEYFETQRQAKRVTSLLVAALRSIQHVVEHVSLGGDQQASSPSLRYPDPQLIDRAWTADVLETQSAIDPAVGVEVLKCVQSFLVQRSLVVAKLRPRDQRGNTAANGTTTTPAPRNEESQDSFAELFDDVGDFDFTDPALDNLLDGGEPAANMDGCAHMSVDAAPSATLIDSIRSKDRLFAEQLRSHTSPALFSLISNIFHPDRAREGRLTSLGISLEDTAPSAATGRQRHQLDALLKRGARRRYLELLVDCWAGCAHVLVENGLRDWGSYVTYGNECWRRLEDPVGKRDVALRFLRDVVALDPEVVRRHDRARRSGSRTTHDHGNTDGQQQHQDHYGEFLQVWFAAAPARSLSVQAEYTHALFYPDVEHDGQDVMPWFPRCSLPASPSGSGYGQLDLPLFESQRTKLILGAIRGMRRDYEGGHSHEEEAGDDDEVERAFRRTQVFPCLSALLSSMRIHLEGMRITPRTFANLNGGRRGSSSDSDDSDRGGSARRESSERGYLAFCRHILQGIEREAGEKILRGARAEVERTWGIVRRKEGEMGVNADAGAGAEGGR